MKYIANSVEVDAYVIEAVAPMEADGSVFLKLSEGQNGKATPAMMSRMGPNTGDYWVIQEDGYVYLNPKDVFERKYRPKTNDETLAL